MYDYSAPVLDREPQTDDEFRATRVAALVAKMAGENKTVLSRDEREKFQSTPIMLQTDEQLWGARWAAAEAEQKELASQPQELKNEPRRDLPGNSIPEMLAAGMIQDALDDFKPGWDPSKLDREVQSFMRTLGAVSADANLTEISINEYLGLLVKRLKGMGYTTLTPAKYRRMATEVFKVMSLEQKQARKAKANASAELNNSAQLRSCRLDFYR